MPKIAAWAQFPAAVRNHLVERMRDRQISIEDLNRLRIWVESKPEVPEGPWYKDFGSFKICGQLIPKHFSLPGSLPPGQNSEPDSPAAYTTDLPSMLTSSARDPFFIAHASHVGLRIFFKLLRALERAKINGLVMVIKAGRGIGHMYV